MNYMQNGSIPRSVIFFHHDRISVFHISDHFIKVVFPFEKPQPITFIRNDRLNELMERVLLILADEPYITAKEISDKLEISESTVRRVTRQLREAEIIMRVGSKKTGYWKIRDIH